MALLKMAKLPPLIALAELGPKLDEAAKKIAANAGCFTCHTISHQDSKDGKLPIGPARADVAQPFFS